MGRSPWSQRKTVEDCITLSIFDFGVREVLEKGPECRGIVRWAYATGKERASIKFLLQKDPEGDLSLHLSYIFVEPLSSKSQYMSYPVMVTSTRCNFGGIRYWFLCPVCKKKVGKLYLTPGGRYFACRTCNYLTYKSCKEHDARVDAFLKNPHFELVKMNKTNLKDIRLILKARDKRIRRNFFRFWARPVIDIIRAD